MSLMFIMCLAGCEREEKTELHFYTKPNVNYQMAYIIYEIYGDPTKIIDGFYFEKNDIVLNIKYGWNEARIESLLNSVDNKQYELICFASYIYLERQPSNSICDDYKNFCNKLSAFIWRFLQRSMSFLTGTHSSWVSVFFFCLHTVTLQSPN